MSCLSNSQKLMILLCCAAAFISIVTSIMVVHAFLQWSNDDLASITNDSDQDSDPEVTSVDEDKSSITDQYLTTSIKPTTTEQRRKWFKLQRSDTNHIPTISIDIDNGSFDYSNINWQPGNTPANNHGNIDMPGNNQDYIDIDSETSNTVEQPYSGSGAVNMNDNDIADNDDDEETSHTVAHESAIKNAQITKRPLTQIPTRMLYDNHSLRQSTAENTTPKPSTTTSTTSTGAVPFLPTRASTVTLSNDRVIEDTLDSGDEASVYIGKSVTDKGADQVHLLTGVEDKCDRWLRCEDPFLSSYIEKFNLLPSCPCTYPLIGGNKIWDDKHKKFFDWKDNNYSRSYLLAYHRGAEVCIRSEVDSGMLASQTCCYDERMKLVTRGSGAGTPSVISPDISTSLHQLIDKVPWIICNGDWTKYNTARPPNNAAVCEENPSKKEFLYQIWRIKNVT